MTISMQRVVEEAEIDEFDVVHFSNYLRWYSGALKRFLARYSEVPGFLDDDVEIRVARLRASYSNSALRGDLVTVSVTRAASRGNYLLLGFRSEARGSVLARAELHVVFINGVTKGLLPVPEVVSRDVAALFLRGAA
jgi:acyl-CoA thioesterase FadM